jgi:hypothetical protein
MPCDSSGLNNGPSSFSIFEEIREGITGANHEKANNISIMNTLGFFDPSDGSVRFTLPTRRESNTLVGFPEFELFRAKQWRSQSDSCPRKRIAYLVTL